MLIKDVLQELKFAPESGYTIKWGAEYPDGEVQATAFLKNGEIRILFEPVYTYEDGSRATHIWFNRNHKISITGEGDQVAILSTVVTSIKEYVKSRPYVKYLIFTAEESSRAKLYKRMVRKLSQEAGWNEVSLQALPLSKNNRPVFIPRDYRVFVLKRN